MLKARCFAPGSPLFENVHYYLLHPHKFNAIVPHQKNNLPPSSQDQNHSNFDLNLEKLISRLSAADSLKVELPPEVPAGEQEDLSKPSRMVNDIASETLALIYEKQGKYAQSIESLKTMQKVKPASADQYQKDIARLTKLMEEENKAK